MRPGLPLQKFCSLLPTLLMLLAPLIARAVTEAPTDWVDPDTGHRIIRLSTQPGSASLYFNVNAYTAEGDKFIITTPQGIATVDLKTHAIDTVVGTGTTNHVVAFGRKTRQVYYTNQGVLYATSIDTKKTLTIAKLPRGYGVQTVNADETLFAGTTVTASGLGWQTGGTGGSGPAMQNPMLGPKVTGTETGPDFVAPDGHRWTFAELKERKLDKRLKQHLPMTLFTLNIKTGAIKTILHSTEWLNHLQFSPADPTLLLFCHEGPWHEVDRIWTIHTDGSKVTLIHHRTMNMEIAGHEFWSADGKTIWYDLQTPRGEDFWVAGYDIKTGARTWYHLQRNEWSVHYNVSPDGTLFAGDGGDSEMVAHAPDGKWLYLFTPHTIPDVAAISAPNSKSLIRPGYFESERLVNMSKHNYQLEPNVSFTPDMKWLIFRSNMFGPVHVFAVELAKAATKS
jgi:oligogalacturonide lyase